MKIDPDIKALIQAKRALLKSTSPVFVRAALVYLWDFFIIHPPKELQEYWKKEKEEDDKNLQHS